MSTWLTGNRQREEHILVRIRRAITRAIHAEDGDDAYYLTRRLVRLLCVYHDRDITWEP